MSNLTPNSNKDEIIDLTSWDYCIPPRIPRVTGGDIEEIIDLVDGPFDDGKIKQPHRKRCNRKRSTKRQSSPMTCIEKEKVIKPKTIGLCSICLDELGKNPLASTKCGHVYCLECLKTSLKQSKFCPSCRRILKGATAYHPLYLDLG